MKWFKHYSDAYSNLKLRIIRQEFKGDGYGAYWLCLELVAQQGDTNFEISKEKQWKKILEFELGIKEEKLELILTKFAELGLIDLQKFQKGILSIPKMIEYQDEYREKVGRKSRQHPDSVGLDKIRTEEDKIRHKQAISLIQAFKTKINPALDFKNRTEYQAALWVLTQVSFEEAIGIVDYAAEHNTDDFAVVITTPWELKKKWAKLNASVERKNNGK